jgi:hypothetical protein
MRWKKIEQVVSYDCYHFRAGVVRSKQRCEIWWKIPVAYEFDDLRINRQGLDDVNLLLPSRSRQRRE